jgi:predicted nuclease of predicted toxin-antitoxin system
MKFLVDAQLPVRLRDFLIKTEGLSRLRHRPGILQCAAGSYLETRNA